MKYNILKNSLCDVNLVEGNKDLTFYEREGLFNDDYTIVTSLSGSDVLVLDFDFGHRIHLDRFEYKFTSGGYDPYLIASGISFYYKNESFEDYTMSDTMVSDDTTFYTSLTDITFSPRYIRFKHNISSTVGNPDLIGDITGFRAINDDSIVDFGVDGTQVEEYIDIARTSLPVVREIKIFNSGENRSTAYVNLEPTGTSFDNILKISTSPDGPWVGINDTEDLIVDSTNFNSGNNISTQFLTGVLTLLRHNDVDGDYFYLDQEGEYISKIFNINSLYTRILLDTVDDQLTYNVSVDKGDPNETIEIRNSSTAPKPYAVTRELRGVTGSATDIGYRDRWLDTGAIKEDSLWSFYSCSSYSSWKDYRVKYDQLTERWYGFCIHWGTSDYYTNRSQLILFNNVGTSSNTYVLSTHSESGQAITYEWIENKCDHTGGVWVYFYCQSYSSGAFVHSTGFYLAYFSSTLSPIFNWYTSNRDIVAMDVDYDSRHIWYTRESSNAVYKVYIDGAVEVNFMSADYTTDLGGIVVLSDHGVLFANDKNIHRLKYNGLFLPEYTLENVVNDKITHMALDTNDENAIWVIFGMSVGKLYVFGDRAGTFDFSLILDMPSSLEVVEDGVWVRCADNISGSIVMNYISKNDRKVTKTLSPVNNSLPGLLYQSYTHSNYAKKLPVATDSEWSELTWKKVSTEGYLSSEDRYYQLRLKFRSQDPIERYPEFVSDPYQIYISSDEFDQLSQTPNQLLWGAWRDKPELNRVFVNNVSKKLILIQDPSTNVNAYIQTSKRMLVSSNSEGLFDVRIKYKIGNGNGVASGKEENLYLYFYNPTVSSTYPYFYVRLYINSAGTTNRVYIDGTNVSLNWDSIGTSPNYYEGEIRAYWNGSTFYGQRRPFGGSFSGTSRAMTESNVGKYFYCQIVADRNGSIVEIDKFEVFQGHTYNYSDSKKVKSIYKQRMVEVKDIYPNNHKSVYIQANVPSDSDVSDYGNVDMKVRWRVPV